MRTGHAICHLRCRLLEELPPEQGRVLRRQLLTTASAQFEAGAGQLLTSIAGQWVPPNPNQSCMVQR
jgi:hypothetical protein